MAKHGLSKLVAWLLPCIVCHAANADDTVSAPLLTIPAYAYSARFSPDGSQIMVGEGSFLNDYAALYDARSGAKIRNFSGHTYYVSSVSFSGDGSILLTGSVDSTCRLWNAKTGELIKRLSIPKERVNGVALSPDGRKALLAIEGEPTYLWDVEADTSQMIFWHSGTVNSLVRYTAFSPDGNLAFTAGDTTVRVWDVRSGRMLRYFSYNGKLVWPIAISGDGSRIVAGLYQGAICVWNTGTGDTIRVFKNKDFRNWTRAVALSPDGKQILAQDDSTAVLWDIATGGRIRTFIGPRGVAVSSEYPEALAFSPDGTKIITAATATNRLCVWNISDIVSARRGKTNPASAPSAGFLGSDHGAIRFSLSANGPMARNRYILTIANPSGASIAKLGNEPGSDSRLEFRASGPLPLGPYFYRLTHENAVLSAGAIFSGK